MPHLSELQTRHADDGVTIIGIAKEDSRGCTAESIRKMTADKGDVMGYTVAIDRDGETYSDYMTAAGQRGIPASFLIDRAGKIAYIGHPSTMDLPIAMVANGTWDPIEGPKKIEVMNDARIEILRGVRGATKESATKLLPKLGSLLAKYPHLADGMNTTHYNLLVIAEQSKKAAKLGRHMVAEAFAAKDSGALNALAWGIVDPAAKPVSRDLDLALDAAVKASKLTGDKDPLILDTLARAHFMKGDIKRAIKLQVKAIDLAKKGKLASATLKGIEAALTEYRAAK